MPLNPQTIGLLSAGLVLVSVIPYVYRIWQRKIQTNPTSWFLWTLIGWTLLLTYDSSGAKANVWPAVLGAINPTVVLLLTALRSTGWQRLNQLERVCLAVGMVSFAMWVFVRRDQSLAQYALYLSIGADACASIPIFMGMVREPMNERPFAWAMFGVAYGLSIFAITEHTFANYALPVYMFVGALAITTPMVWHRLKYRQNKWI
ncbi:MAG: hypothetical protein AAB388_01940 [Patescibacteria group bacterium]